ncbi:FAD binding domain-containing protein [Alloacidobacterium dinghuense]|uniref:FAD binding domain-containing protein n=1 Tax=Alloacidobacterium dinghuense TaxID=2763107 RepID=A0A7G8BKU7_9BACT|nr:FAD binding domain-containing protein [Alloacidobacterium dinghuense]QNI33167.1 FAD binding domain-containing protein [Alloacidobacterium dinghuense]
MNSFVLANCTTVDGALSQLRDGAVIKAGGVDLLDRMKIGIEQPSKLVNIRSISGLRGIHQTDSGLTIGALTTLSEISEHPVICKQYQILSDACGSAATPHIRNMATLGGNLLQRIQCWYYRSADFECLRKGKDMCFAFDGLNQYHAIMDYGACPAVAPSSAAVALLALNASVELNSTKRGKRVLAVKDLYVTGEDDPTKFTAVGPDELLTSIMIPKPAIGTRSAYQKYGEKESFDWAIADAGVLLEMDGNICRRAVITMGAASPVVRRSSQAEAVLSGKPITEANAWAAGKAAMEGAHPLSMNAYKVELFPVAIYRTILLAAGQMDRDPSAAG